MPRELIAQAGGHLEFREYRERGLARNHVRIRTEFAAAKHGTEAAIVRGYAARRGAWDAELQLYDRSTAVPSQEPVPVGNMFVGTVVEIGSAVSRITIGDGVLGYGAFRETHTSDESSLRALPEGISWKSAVCLDPAFFALAAVRDGNIRAGDAVAVFGLGAIGLMVVQIAKLAGAYPVIAVSSFPKRRDAAVGSGADLAFDPATCDVGVEIKQATGRRGADVIVEYNGSAQALQAALRGVAFGGAIVAGAYPPPHADGLDLGAEAHLNIPQIVFSRGNSEPNRDHPRWSEPRLYDTCWRWICQGRLDGDKIVDFVVPFDDLPAAYTKILSTPDAGIKLGTYL